jgi:hypothetical protein
MKSLLSSVFVDIFVPVGYYARMPAGIHPQATFGRLLVLVIVQFGQVAAALEGHFKLIKVFHEVTQITVILLDTGVRKPCLCIIHPQKFEQANMLWPGKDVLVGHLNAGLPLALQ